MYPYEFAQLDVTEKGAAESKLEKVFSKIIFYSKTPTITQIPIGNKMMTVSYNIFSPTL